MKITNLQEFHHKITIREIILFLIIASIGISYISYNWISTKKEQSQQALQIALSVKAALPFDDIQHLKADPADETTVAYQKIKQELQNVIQTNKKARFAYLYLLRDGKLYFMVDSEPEGSPDISPPGQEFTEADPIDFQPFKTGQAQVTNPVTDRWGTWVSIEVPIKNSATGEIIAAFGMDYNAGSWGKTLFFEVFKSSALVLLALILILAIRISLAKNRFLQKEIQEREIAENKLKERERQLADLIGNLPGIVYRCALDENCTMDFISDSCTRITGYTPEEFVTKKTISFNDLIIHEYRKRIWQKLQVVIHEKRVFEEEYPIITSTGEIKWLWERGRGILNGKGELQCLEGYIEDITERKEAEKKLLQSEANLTRTIEESPLGIRIISKDGKTLFANRTLLRIFEFESLDDFNQIPVSSWYSPESYSEYLIREEKRRNGEDVEPEYEISIVRKSGEIIHLQVHRRKILWNGVLNDRVIYQDITNRKLAETQLKKLSMAIEQNPVSIVITNLDGVIEYVNPKFTEIAGYEASEAIGQNPGILKSGKMDDQFYTDLWTTITSGKIWQGELINKSKSGELYWINKSISPIMDSEGRITNFVSIGEEITEKKRKEAELIKAKDKAEESDRLKSAFLANISHEIRTPMNGILGFADLLKTPNLSPENKEEFIAMIEKSGQRMLSTLNDLINISIIESGEMNLKVTDVNVNHLFEKLYGFFKPQADSKNLIFSYYRGLPNDVCLVKTDGHKLHHILTNLINNGLKFTNQGQVEFGYTMHGSRLKIYVKDTGIGIPEGHEEIIFERFRQGSTGLCRKYEGAGLGLSISKAYVEQLGGSIRVESELGKGSTFLVELPINFMTN